MTGDDRAAAVVRTAACRTAAARYDNVVRQVELFASREVTVDETFAGAVRLELEHGAWIDHVPGWVRGHDASPNTVEPSACL